MNSKIPLIAAMALGVTLLSACEEPVDTAAQEAKCKAFADHVAEVLVKEHDNKEPAEKEKMVAATIKSCVESPPSQESMDCAMKAQTGRDIKACDNQAK
jgi:hypothetical protein